MPQSDNPFDFNLDRDDIVIYKLGKIETLLTEVKINQEAHAAADLVFHKDIEVRTSKLERKWAWASGIAAGVSFVVTVIFNWFYKTGKFV